MRRALHSPNVRLGLLLISLFARSANATTVNTTDYITSGFNSLTTDGWTGTGATLTYSTAVPPGNSPLPSFDPGVNPGFLDVSDSQNAAMYIHAPTTATAFGGDLSRFYGNQIYFDAYIRKISGGSNAVVNTSWGVISITGNGLTASYDVGTLVNGATGYARFYAPLLSTSWYSGTSGTGTHLIDGQLQTILGNVSDITIDMSLKNSSSDDVAFDNFTIGVPEPASCGFICLGLIGIITARRRLRHT